MTSPVQFWGGYTIFVTPPSQNSGEGTHIFVTPPQTRFWGGYVLPPPEKTREGTHKMLPPPKNVLPPPRGGVTVYLSVKERAFMRRENEVIRAEK